MTAALIEILAAEGPLLSQRVLADMYRDPFWMERFGPRGRRHADEDSDFHLQYLRRALAAGDPAVLVRYARWLREVLVTRGMCSSHLGENFRRLSDAIAASGWPGHETAVAYLRVAEEALEYPGGAARAIQQRLDDIGEQAEAAYARRHPRGQLRLVRFGGFHQDLAGLACYVADALALGSEATFVTHVRWMHGFIERRAAPAAATVHVLDALGEVLARDASTAEGVACIDAARAALAVESGTPR